MRKLFIIAIIALGCTLFSQGAFAARLYILPTSVEAVEGDILPVSVRLDVQQDETNTVEVRLEFPDNLLVFSSFSDGGSLVNIWIEKPQFVPVANCKKIKSPCGMVIMSGIIPGGFTGDGLIVDLEFKAKKSGAGKMEFLDDSKVFANAPDGKTLFTIANAGEFEVQGSEKDGKPNSFEDKPEDRTPPEEFVIKLDRGDVDFGEQWFITFTTQDKNSGIDYYEVQERKFGLIDNGWKKVDAPYYILENQSLLSAITVRAVNGFGISRSVTVYPAKLKVIYGTLVGLLMITILLLVFKKIVHRFPGDGMK